MFDRQPFTDPESAARRAAGLAPAPDAVSDAAAGFAAEVDGIDPDGWERIVAGFADADLSQTAAYGAVRWRRHRVSRLVLRRHGEIAAAAQVALVTLPPTGRGLAYVKWGPMWRRRGAAADPDALHAVARALRNEYGARCGLTVRLMPRLLAEPDGPIDAIRSAGFRAVDGAPVRTFRLDLTPTVATLRGGLKRKWRRDLGRAEDRGLRVTEHDGGEAMDVFMAVYRGMRRRKAFRDVSEIGLMPRIQDGLPPDLQLRTAACRDGDEPLAAVAYWSAGDTPIALFGATTGRGLQLGASYFLNWHLLCRLKARGHDGYDLGGAGDPRVNHFKAGLAGRHGGVADFVGRFDAPGDWLSRCIVGTGDAARRALRR